jgi:hypothetical protein
MRILKFGIGVGAGHAVTCNSNGRFFQPELRDRSGMALVKANLTWKILRPQGGRMKGHSAAVQVGVRCRGAPYSVTRIQRGTKAVCVPRAGWVETALRWFREFEAPQQRTPYLNANHRRPYSNGPPERRARPGHHSPVAKGGSSFSHRFDSATRDSSVQTDAQANNRRKLQHVAMQVPSPEHHD